MGIEVLDKLEEMIEVDLQGIVFKAYPALVKNGKQVNIRVLENKKIAEQETQKALRQLFVNELPEQMRYLKKSIPDIQNLCLKYADFGGCEELKLDIVNKVIDDVFLYEDVGTVNEFTSRLDKGKSEIHAAAVKWGGLLSSILDEYRSIKKILKSSSISQLDVVSDIQLQLNNLFPKGFITIIDEQWLREYPRYLSGIKKRYDKSQDNANRDRGLRLNFSRLWEAYIMRHELLLKQHIESEQLKHYRWMLEEYRISLYAQELKTKFPVSEKRLKKYWNELSDI